MEPQLAERMPDRSKPQRNAEGPSIRESSKSSRRYWPALISSIAGSGELLRLARAERKPGRAQPQTAERKPGRAQPQTAERKPGRAQPKIKVVAQIRSLLSPIL